MRKLWVVSWVLNDRPGSLATFSYDEADRKIRQIFEKNGLVFMQSYEI